MPTKLYGTLYGHDNLYIVMTMLKDIYAKKPQLAAAAAAATVAQGATAPFTTIRTPTRTSPKAQDESSLEERIAQPTETLYCIDLDGKPVWKPFKPFITRPRRRFKGGFNKGCTMDMVDASVILMEETIVEDTKEIEDASDLEDHLENLTKVLILNILESQVDHSTKTKFVAMNVKNLATCRKIVQN